MIKGGLNLFLKLAGFAFRCKQKLIKEKGLKVLYWALLMILVELFAIIVSLPLFFFISPEKGKRGGFFSSKQFDGNGHLREFQYRRKIGLTTLFGAILIFVIKVIVVSLLSFLIAVQPLLAVTESWTFDTPASYTYDSGKIEVTGGAAQLKDLSSPSSGSTTNSGFDSSATGWTAVPG